MKKLLTSLLIIFFTLTAIFHFALAQDNKTTSINVAVFYGQGCPHCAKAIEHIQGLKNTIYPEIEITPYEIYYNQENRELFLQYSKAYNFEPTGVPIILINDTYVRGSDLQKINQAVENAQLKPYKSPEEILNNYLSGQNIQTSQTNNHDEDEITPLDSDLMNKQDKTASTVGWLIITIFILGLISLIIYNVKNKKQEDTNQ